MGAAAVVLAAGGSKRLGQAKQLLQIGNEVFVDHAIRMATEAGCSPVIAVLGAHADVIKNRARLAASVVENAAWEEGMASSIRAGLEALHTIVTDSEVLLLLTCDQYAVTVEHLRALLATAAEGKIAASAYGGGAGIPAAFPKKYFLELLALEGDVGAKSLLEKHADVVQRIRFDKGELDVDTPEDLKKAVSEQVGSQRVVPDVREQDEPGDLIRD